MTLEEKKANDYLIGIILGLTFLTKQNIGIYLYIPTLFINSMKTFHCRATAIVVIVTTTSVSISRSVTSVPSDCANGILLYCSSITQRDTSPKRGITRFAA